MEFTSFQKNQQLPQKTSHIIVKKKICLRRSAVHQPEEPCSSPHHLFVKEKKDESVRHHDISSSAVTPYQISCQLTSSRSMSPSRNSETVVLSYQLQCGHWSINSWVVYIPHENSRSNNWRSFADDPLLQDVRNAQESFPTLLVVTIMHSTHIAPNSWIPPWIMHMPNGIIHFQSMEVHFILEYQILYSYPALICDRR